MYIEAGNQCPRPDLSSTFATGLRISPRTEENSLLYEKLTKD